MSESEEITYKIGEVARMANVNKETIRYYERRDLITKPNHLRSGYRIFTARQIDEIKFIKRAQQLGFTLNEIKEMMTLRIDENISCEKIRTKAEKKYQDIIRKIEDLEKIKAVLVNLIDSCKTYNPIEDCVILKALEGKNNMVRKT